MRMPEFADGEGCADAPWADAGKGSQTMPAALCMAAIPLPATSHAGHAPPQGSSCPLPGYHAINEGLPHYLPLPHTPNDDMKRAKPASGWDRKTSTIDALLSPQLLDHIKRTGP
jgi:hypothetical protein